jgi:hypothetical protein
MKTGSASPISLTIDVDPAHPPAVVVDVDPAVHPRRGAQVAGGKVVGALPLANRLVLEPVLVDSLAEVVDHGAFEEVEHMSAHDGGAAGEIGEVDGPEDALRLHDDVVVEEHDVLALTALDSLMHAPREAAGSAEVALLNELELVAEHGGGFLETGLVPDLLVALVSDDEPVHDGEQFLGLGKRPQVLDAVVRPVERGHGDGERAGCEALRLRNRPVGLLQGHVVTVGNEVEPVPAAVGEGGQGQVAGGRGATCQAHALNAVRTAPGAGLVNDDSCFGVYFKAEPYSLHVCVGAPVAGGKSIEVRSEGNPSVRGQRQLAAAQDEVRTHLAPL